MSIIRKITIFADMEKNRLHETIVYSALWAVAFIAPAAAAYIDALHDAAAFSISPVFKAWAGMVPFFALFLIHDLLVAPLLLRRGSRRRWLFASLLLLAAFSALEITLHPARMQPREEPVPMSKNSSMPPRDSRTPPQDKPAPPPAGRHGAPPPKRPHPMNPTSLANIAMGIMLCGANLGIKLYFKAQRDEAVSMERERQSLNKELEFLTYQINPHLLMNTLNNIHALIDIDPAKAKSTIIELSRMMRYTLYDGREKAVSLKKEIDFLNHYITLMRLRYTDCVEISADFSRATDNALVPPLLLVTFVENAFKHGISYRAASYIHVSAATDNGRLTFRCDNSAHPKPSGTKRGIGLENVRKRLRLIYDTRFKLTISNKDGRFSVILEIPISHDKMYSD